MGQLTAAAVPSLAAALMRVRVCMGRRRRTAMSTLADLLRGHGWSGAPGAAGLAGGADAFAACGGGGDAHGGAGLARWR